MAELTSDQLELQTSWNTLPTDSVKQALDENHKAILNASHFEQKDPDAEQAEMVASIWQEEIDIIHQTKTWSYAQDIMKGKKEGKMAMFKMAGEVLQTFNVPLKDLTCQVLDGYKEWHPRSGMFLHNGTGKYFVTFDPPFTLRMEGNGRELVNDVPGTTGLYVYYCIQFNMSEDHKMQIFKAGIVFAQHVSVNPARLSTLAYTMQRELTSLSCSMAVEGATWTNAPGTGHQAQPAPKTLALDCQPAPKYTMTRLGTDQGHKANIDTNN